MVAKLSQKFLKKLALVLVLFVVFSFSAYAKVKLSQDDFLHLYYFDVGQGNASLLRYKNFEILIDAGPNNVIMQKLSQTMPWDDQEIEMVVVTHPHQDHIGGLAEVLGKYKVDRVLLSDVSYDSKTFFQINSLIKEKNIQIDYATQPRHYQITPNFYLDTIFPNQSFNFTQPKEIHDSMVVTRVTFKQKVFLFSGDLEKSNEEKIIKNGQTLKSDILLAGHHGSKTSSSPAFLQGINPSYYIISAGKDNKYGHPHAEVLDRVKGLGLKVLRTDEVGDIFFRTDGVDLSELF